MPNPVYEASVFEYSITYRDFKGTERTSNIMFALSPLDLLQIFADYRPKKSRSGNPAKQGIPEEVSDAEQIALVRGLATKAAGHPSDDGQFWFQFDDFDESLAGQAFLTRLVTSDEVRNQFSLKVILEPMRAFVNFAKTDASNTPKEIAALEDSLKQMEKVFSPRDPSEETLEERRARLEAEMAALQSDFNDG